MLATVATVAAAGPAWGGAFQINERSAKSQGMSYADSVSGAEDITYVGFNPAALRQVENFEAGGNLSIIFPISEGETTDLLVGGAPAPLATAEALGFTTSTNSDRTGVPLAAALGYRVDEDIIIGFTTHVPFGLSTENPDNFIGAFDGTSSVLVTFQASPTIAVELTDTFAVGAAFNLLFTDARLGSNIVNLDGNAVNAGFSFGTLWDVTPSTTIGLSYHHGYDVDVDAEAEFTTLAPGGLAGLAGVPLNADVTADLPATVQAGVTHRFTDDIRMSAEFRYINWSVFDEITTAVPAVGVDTAAVQNYEDAVFAAIGGEYDFNENLTGRLGFAFDQTPTQDFVPGIGETGLGRTVRVPDASRVWFSTGGSYDMELFGMDMTLDAAYSFLLTLEDPEVVLVEGPFAGSTVEYRGGAHILSIGGSIRF